MPACLKAEEVEALVTDGLTREERARLEAHLAVCADCRDAVEARRRDSGLAGDVKQACRTATVFPSTHPTDPGPSEGPPLTESIEGYDILREINRGGQGVVYKAVQKATKRTVALKVLLQGTFASARQRHRFEREIDLAASLQHPNIVTVYDSGVTQGRHYFAMEYIHGQPLDVYLSNTDLSIDETLRLFAKICAAVNYAHQRGVIHRDLKPGNIRIDAPGEPHVLDFGLAKSVGQDLTSGAPVTVTGEFMGTLAYASPEQTKGDPNLIDIRTDVYSLGVILYEMLTGKYPYQVVGEMAVVLKNIAEAEPKRPSTICHQINDEVETIVLKALAKEKERRYQSAGNLLEDVEHFLQGEPVEAKRDSALYVLRKHLQRFKLPMTIALFAVLLLGGFAITMSIQAKRNARLAEDNKALAATERAARHAEAEQRQLAEKGEQEATKAHKQALSESERAKRAAEEAKLAKSEAQEEAREKQVALERATRLELQATIRAKEAEESRSDIQRLNELLQTRNRALDEKTKVAVRLEQLAEKRAESLRIEANRAATVRHFLENALISAAPNFAADNLEYLAALERLAGDFDHNVGEPALEIAVRNIISRAYASLSRYDLAEPHAQRAFEMAHTHLAKDHPETISAMCSLAAVLAEKAEYTEADRIARAAQVAAEARLAQDHPDRLRADFLVAELLADQGRHRRAEAMHRDVLNRRLRAFGPYHLETVASQRALAMTLSEMGEREAAVHLLRNARNIARNMLGDDAPLTLSINVDLVWSLVLSPVSPLQLFSNPMGSNREATYEALDLIKWTYERCQRTLGWDDSLTVLSGFSYLCVCFQARQFYEILALDDLMGDKTTLEQLDRSDKPDKAVIVLAMMGYLTGDDVTGMAMTKRAIEIADRRLPAGHVSRAFCRHVAADNFATKQRYEQAEELLLEALAEAKQFEQGELERLARESLRNIYKQWGKSELAARYTEPSSE